jgi:hypothetical protein
LLASAADVAAIFTVYGVGTALGAEYSPAELMVPIVPLPPWTLFTDQLTAALKFPVPETVAEHWLVWVVGTVAVEHETATDVIVGVGADVPPLEGLPPPQPDSVKDTRKARTSEDLQLIRAPLPSQIFGENYRHQTSIEFRRLAAPFR